MRARSHFGIEALALWPSQLLVFLRPGLAPCVPSGTINPVRGSANTVSTTTTSPSKMACPQLVLLAFVGHVCDRVHDDYDGLAEPAALGQGYRRL